MKTILKNKYELSNVLKKEAEIRNIIINDNIIEKLLIYMELVLDWNERINLTAIKDEYEFIYKHFIDCLEIVKYINKGNRVIDVGTGAGFPGIVIAIYFDTDIKVTLLDALNKRLVFLQEVVDKLNLGNVELVHGRAEEISKNEIYRQQFDIVVSRAVANLNILLELDVPYIKVGGKGLFMKGSKAQEELNEAIGALKLLNCKFSNIYNYQYIINDEVYIRNIIDVEKFNNTSNKYPRIYGKILKNPLK